MKKNRFLLISIIFISGLVSNVNSSENNITTFFDISFLSPIGGRCGSWTILMEQQLPKIGIGVKYHETVGMDKFSYRTFNYPVGETYAYIPTYENGGFDICFLGLDWDYDFNPSSWFDSISIPPNGNNICQFKNTTYDQILEEYLNSLTHEYQISKLKEIQKIIYEELPTISVFYCKMIYGISTNLTNIDPNLLYLNYHNPENWGDLTNDEIVYAIPIPIGQNSSYYIPSFNNFIFPLHYFDGLWMKAVYGTLFKRDQISHEYVTNLASDYTFNTERTCLTIDLRAGIKFSNGHPVLAEDIKYTYDLLKTEALQLSCYCHPYDTYIDSTDVVDNDTVIFNFTQPINYFLSVDLNNVFDLLNFGIIERSSVEPLISIHGYDIFDDFPFSANVSNALITSCGPFVLNKYDQIENEIELIPNQYWNGDEITIEKIKLIYVSGKDNAVNGLLSGSIDIIDYNYYPVLADFESSEDIVSLASDCLRSQEMIINLKHPILGTGELAPEGTKEAAKSIRKAISHSVPRQLLVEERLDNLGSAGVTCVPKGCFGFDDSLLPYEYNLTL
ncbi:MAG: ABC transporter substrate-binding protein, partial [Candidatus Heimdallarchaeota archaeon]